jgi:trehalose-6-phosphate synthase
MRAMRRYLLDHDVNRWARAFLRDLHDQPDPD